MERSDPVVVVGAGIIGASISYHLAKRGVEVVILDQVGPAAGATGKSFAWINANHLADAAYHRLRYQSLTEYHRLDRELGGALGLRWEGALCFDLDEAALDQRLAGFQALGYPVERVTHNRFGDLEPNYRNPPKRALRAALEAAIEPARATLTLIDAAVKLGARTMYGARATSLSRANEWITGIETEAGQIRAGTVLLAAGTGVANLLATIGVDLPMADKPGLMLQSRPIERVLDHVIWGDRIHIKQQADGRLVIGEIFSDGRFDQERAMIVETMLTEARRCLPDTDIEIESTTVGMRPMPGDGMPVVGPVDGAAGLYLAVMHSGITLAPLIGRMAAEEVLDDVRFEQLAPYRFGRFAKA